MPWTQRLPAFSAWQRYSGQHYFVYVDESAWRFFGLANPDGNFCHATVGIPAGEVLGLEESLEEIRASYHVQVNGIPREQPQEMKYTGFRRLPQAYREEFFRLFCRELVSRGGFLTGFYTSVRGFVMEELRESLIESVTSIPDEHEDLYLEIRNQLLQQMAGVGQAPLLSRLLTLPIVAIAFFMNAFECTFDVIYDPRHPDEDAIVCDAVTGFVEAAQPLLSKAGTGYQRMITNRHSEDVFGLQLADLVAGEVRQFLRSRPELRDYGSTLELVTGGSEDELAEYERIDNALVKRGRFIELPPDLRDQLSLSNEDSQLPMLFAAFAAGLLTCVTSHGLERDLHLFEGRVFDLCD